MTIHRFHTLTSTNSQMATIAPSLAHGDIVICHEQTAGRGQRGNSWESEPGRNLTFSLLLRPRRIEAPDAFLMSMAVSIGITEALRKLLCQDVLIKWPNDIYVGDRKLAGILIENSFSGRKIGHAIIGIGLNVNQTVFRSDAPNPVSMAELSGHEYDLDEVLETVTGRIVAEVDAYESFPRTDLLVEHYHNLLWRRQGIHRWHDCITDKDITAAIAHVSPTGHLTLATTPPRTYAFKEVAAIL